MEDEAEIKQQILQLEFQHKKEMVEIRKLQETTEKRLDYISRLQDRTQKQLDHITKLTGIAFDEFEFYDQKMQDAGEILSRKK